MERSWAVGVLDFAGTAAVDGNSSTWPTLLTLHPPIDLRQSLLDVSGKVVFDSDGILNAQSHYTAVLKRA